MEQNKNKKITCSKEEFITAVNDGLTINQIMKKFNFSRRDVILRKAKNLGIDTKLKEQDINIIYKKIPYDELVELVNKGYTDIQLAEHFKCHISSIEARRKKFNLKVNRKNRILNIENFSEEEFQVLYGTLLGDAYLSCPKNNVQGSFTHCLKQKEFIEYKQSLLKRFCEPVRIVNKKDKRPKFKKEYQQYYCYIKGSKALNNLYPKVYKNKIKYINKELLYKLNGLGIAIWFMDDGSKINYSYTIATMGFSLEDVNTIKLFLKEKFNIECTICKNKNLYIKAKSKHIFTNLIKPYIIPSMIYKLH